MLNTLANIYDKILKNENIEKNKLDSFLVKLKTYDKNEYLYVQAFIRETQANENECFMIFSYLVKYSIVKVVYRVVCPYCNHQTKEVFHFNDIEEYDYCEECDESVLDKNNLFKYISVFYKLIKDIDDE